MKRARVALFLAAMMLATPAHADPSRVVIVRERGADAIVARAEVRLAAELRAAGFVVEEREVDSAGDARKIVDDESGGAFATILLRRAGGGAATDIWVADHVTKKTVVRRIAGGAGEGGDRVLAMRVVEVMRASLVEPLVMEPRESPPIETPPDVARFATPDRVDAAPVRERTSFAIGAGASALYASSSTGLAWAPSIAFDVGACSICRVRALVVGPAFGASVDAAQGTARVRQELALAEFALEASLRRLRPFVAIGAGAYHLDARGTARAPFVDGEGDAWAALSSIGAGARLRIASAAALSLGARALFAFPRPVVVFAGAAAATAGRPAILGTIALEVDL